MTCGSRRWSAKPRTSSACGCVAGTWTACRSPPASSSRGASSTGPGWLRGHPYSLSAAPTGNTLRITVKDLGDGSRALASLRPGTRVAVEGPYGRMHSGVRTRRKVTMLAGGIGVTPLRALLEELPQGPGDVTLVYRASSARRGRVPRRAGRAGSAAGGARCSTRLARAWLVATPGCPAHAAHLSDADALRQLVPDVAEHDVYLCGADAWMEAAGQAALAAGVPAERIHLERFTW